jgi:ribonuclease HI
MIVRTDGNNFIAELAAAITVIRACPPKFPITLRIDSKAAIGALQKGHVSERRRVRAAGRAWLNFGRQEILAKRDHIQIEHIRAHQEVRTPEQQGNNSADEIAKSYLRLGESREPVKYFTHSEETFILCRKNGYIHGDVRSHLKKLSDEQLIGEWKSKSPKQFEFFQSFSRQILAHSRDVWRWAIERRWTRLALLCLWHLSMASYATSP